MQTDNSILFVSALVLSALYIYFFFKPLALTELAGKAFAFFIGASLALVLLILNGVFLFAAICMLIFIVLLTLQRIPVFRYIEPHSGNGVVMINRIIDRYYWPLSNVITECGYRRGTFLGVLTWIDTIHDYQYIYQGKTFNSMREFRNEYPHAIGKAEDALNKSLGSVQ